MSAIRRPIFGMSPRGLGRLGHWIPLRSFVFNRKEYRPMYSNALKRAQQSDLRAGDVLVCRPAKHTGFGLLIKKVSDSPYTHAAIYLGRGLVAESTFRVGVGITSLQTLIERYAHVAVLRHPDAFTHGRPARLGAFVHGLIARGAGYAPLLASSIGLVRRARVNDPLGELKRHRDTGSTRIRWTSRNYFCSQLVVAALIDSGFIGESAVPIFHPRTFYPGDFFSDTVFGFSVGFLTRFSRCAPPADDPLRQIDSINIFESE